MSRAKLAAQLYTVRDHCQTAADLAVSARRIRELGYEGVQVSGIGPIPVPEIRAIMQGEGLEICVTHEPAEMILERPQEVVARLKELGCARTAYPYPSNVDFGDPAAVRRLVAKLDAAGAVLRAAGLTLGYHNHAIEFVKFGETTVLEYIYAHTDPRNLVAELDTYWIHYGGGDVVAWCRRMKGRLPFIHLKDYGFTLENRHTMCAVGAGNLPFARIIAEARTSGCEWFIVELDVSPGDPFDSLRAGREYLCAQRLLE